MQTTGNSTKKYKVIMARQQDDLAGVEGPGVSIQKIKSVDEALETLLAARSKRMKMADQEKEAQTALVQLFHKHELTVYRFDDAVYELVDIEKIKRAKKDGDDD